MHSILHILILYTCINKNLIFLISETLYNKARVFLKNVQENNIYVYYLQNSLHTSVNRVDRKRAPIFIGVRGHTKQKIY